MAITPYMNLLLPTVSLTVGPAWASQINSALTAIDSHNHSPGQGQPIPTNGLYLNADLPFNGFNASLLRSVRLNPQVSPLSDPADLGSIYVKGVDLYYNDASGNQIRITASGSVAGAPGSIGGLTSPAAVTYSAVAHTFSFTSSSNVRAALDVGAVLIHEPVAGANAISIVSPSALSSPYNLNLFAGLPASQKIVTFDQAGQLAAAYDVDASSLQISANTLSIKPLGVQGSMLNANVVDASSLQLSGTQLSIKALGITGAMFAASVYDNTSIGLSSGALYVKASGIQGSMLNANVVDNASLQYAATVLSIKASGVLTAHIADANVTTLKIADSNVTTAKIADANVTTLKIADLNVTTGKIANLAVDNTKLAVGVAVANIGYTPYNATNPNGYISGITSLMVTTALGFTPLNSTSTAADATKLNGQYAAYYTDIVSRLGYTPYNATNPSGFISGITGGNVTAALGFTPYNATNPSAFITSAGAPVQTVFGRTGTVALLSSDVTTALGFTPYNATNPSSFTTLTGTAAADLNTAAAVGAASTAARADHVHRITSGNVTTALGFTPYNATNPSGFLTSGTVGTYAPSLTGTGASGTWGISITGDAPTVAGCSPSGAPVWGSSGAVIPIIGGGGIMEIGRYIDFHSSSGCGGEDYTVRLDAGTAGSTTLNLVGSFVASGDVSAYSDISLKDNIEVIPNALSKVMALRGVTFNRNDLKGKPRGTGVIAQEVQAVLPEAVKADEKGLLTVAYGNVVGLLIEAIKELQARINVLEAR